MKRHYSNKSVNHCLFCFFIIVTNMLLMTIVDDTFGLGPCASVPCGEPIYDPEGHFIRCKTCSEGGCEGACVNVNGQRMCRPCGGDDNKECCDIFHCCPAGHCCGSTCYDPATQGCCNGQPYDLATEQCCYDQPTPYKIPLNQECCHGDHCNTPQCKYCGFNYETWEYECMNMCDPEKCKTCDGHGNCVVCDGDPNKCCNNGTCIKKCNSMGETCLHSTPGILSTCPMANIDDSSCGAWTIGLVCSWEESVVHRYSAKCSQCGSPCGVYPDGEPCSRYKPVVCGNKWILFYGMTCTCCDTPALWSWEPSGIHYRCP